MEDNFSTFFESIDKMKDVLGGVVKVTESNSEQTSIMLQQMQQTKELLNGLKNRIISIEDTSVKTDERLTTLENHTEITTNQCDVLNDLIASRITSLLRYGSYDYHVYHGEFQKILRREAHKTMGVPLKMSKVMKRDYDRYRDFIEAYVPVGGVSKLKDSLSNNLNVIKNKSKYSYLLNN